ncbi:MAG: sigma-70 family RNA polymerase sigma factor [Roseiflexaceae bacterium]
MTDAELIERLKQRDESAYREALARYGDRLYGYVYSLVGDHHLCEDIVGETYLRLVERIDEFRYTGISLKAWLFRVAHNHALNTLRQHKRADLLGDEQAEIEAPDDPAREVGSQLEAAELRDALGMLTADQQQVLLLRFVARQNPGEVAQTMSKSETAVKQLQLRALRSLKRFLGGES